MTPRGGSLPRGIARALVALVLLAWLALPAAAEWRVVPDRVETASGPTLRYNVFLPDGYDPARGPYPLLVLLHGAGGDEQSWAGRIRLWQAVEDGVRAGRLPKLIAVMPGATNTWWIDSGFARAETAVVSDLLGDVARKYPVMTSREGRAIAGFSAGAYGALRIVLRHPHLFGAAALWAPAIYAEAPPPLSAARRSPAFAGPDGAFDLAAWTRNAWPALLPRYLAQHVRVPIYLAAGDDDRLEIAYEAAKLARALYRRQPEALELRVVDAGHTMRVWEATAGEALAFLFAHLARIGLARLEE
ncbi:alpha/beta hydrolase [Elioraea sp.]|uniref:alpha/beta hydrolase n=1 Tax=Elioraea sp. TaxID=2185103 RepID=UPI003F7258E1